MTFKLSERSHRALIGVHPLLVAVVDKALTISPVDFAVIEGRRTVERQRVLLAEKKTTTMNSRHLTGHAVDLAPWVNGDIPWKDTQAFRQIRDAMFTAAAELGAKIRWGGDWNGNGRSDDETFYDGPHFELRREFYP